MTAPPPITRVTGDGGINCGKEVKIFLLKMQTALGLKKKANASAEEHWHAMTDELPRLPASAELMLALRAYTGQSPG